MELDFWAKESDPDALAKAHDSFRRWLGDEYDLQALDIVLAAAAVEQLQGDPVWLLLISGSGNAKTETVQALSGVGGLVVSTIASEGALLSATSKKERTTTATGGLLRQVGERGILVIKDVTSIISMNRDSRSQVLAALRETYDGQWVRLVGTDGGQRLEWTGRIVVVGAVTTAWDKAHSVIAAMGDRFVLVRMDSTQGRLSAGRQAIANTGFESEMRQELAAVVGSVLANVNTEPIIETEAEREALLAAADLVTTARTAVEYDYRGDVIDAHQPEAPTRFAKQLTQVMRGAVSIGVDRGEALLLAIRCARDSMPPLRLSIVDDLSAFPNSGTNDVRKRLQLPRATVDRQLQALHILGVLEQGEEPTANGTTRWVYRLADGIDPQALNPNKLPEMSVPTPYPPEERPGSDTANEPRRLPTDKSGTHPERRCESCDEPLLLIEPGRTSCERCRLLAAT